MLTGRRYGGTPARSCSVEHDASGVRLFEAREHAQQRGLAAAGRSEQREELAREDIERQRVDGDEIAEALGDVVERDDGPCRHGGTLKHICDGGETARGVRS